MSVADILDNIAMYSKLFKKFNYSDDGNGALPWSHKVSHVDGSTIEFRASEWVYNGPRGRHTGTNAQTLGEFLVAGIDYTQLA